MKLAEAGTQGKQINKQNFWRFWRFIFDYQKSNPVRLRTSIYKMGKLQQGTGQPKSSIGTTWGRAKSLRGSCTRGPEDSLGTLPSLWIDIWGPQLYPHQKSQVRAGISEQKRLWDFLASHNVFQTLSSQKSPVSNMDCKIPRAEGRKHTADPPVSPQSNVFHRAVHGKQPGVSEEGHPTPTLPKNEL